MILLFLVLVFVPVNFGQDFHGYVGFPSRTQAVSNKEKLNSCESVKITKVGCYSDFMRTPRPLPELVLTDRDTSSDHSDGHLFDWENPVTSMQDLACRCAKRVVKKHYTLFSLQFFAECWSGKNSNLTYSHDGPSNRCLGVEYKTCNDKSDTPCTGVNFSNYVYRAEANHPNRPTENPNCVDKYQICEHYASIDLCNNKFPLVLQFCRKSCKLC